MPSLRDLLQTPTRETWLDRILEFLRLRGFPVGAWQTTSFLRYFVETEADSFSDVNGVVAKIAAGGFLKLSSGDWLSLVAENVFDEVRKPAVFAEGTATLADVGNVGPVTYDVGALWVTTAGRELRFANSAAITLPLGGSVTIYLRAEAAGEGYNVGNGAIDTFVSVTPGLTVSNPAGASGTWLTVQGVDVEGDDALKQRCIDKWGLLGSGATDGAYRYWSSSASPEITKVRAYSPGGGSVRVVVSGPSGPVSAAALGAAAALVESKRPLGVPDVVVSNAVAVPGVVGGTLVMEEGRDGAAAVAAAQAAVVAFAQGLGIGAKVSRERLVRELFVDGVADLQGITPAADLVLADNEVFVPSFALVSA